MTEEELKCELTGIPCKKHGKMFIDPNKKTIIERIKSLFKKDTNPPPLIVGQKLYEKLKDNFPEYF